MLNWKYKLESLGSGGSATIGQVHLVTLVVLDGFPEWERMINIGSAPRTISAVRDVLMRAPLVFITCVRMHFVPIKRR